MAKHFVMLCSISAVLALTLMAQSEARAGDKERVLVDVEVRIATLANQNTLDWLNSLKDQSGEVRMTATQATEFAKAFQGDRRNNLMQIPKMTALNGHKAKFNLTEEFSYVKTLTVGGDNGKLTLKPGVDSVPLGVRFEVLPTVASNQKDVTLTFSTYLANLDGPVPMIPVTTLDVDQKPVKNFIQLPSVVKIEFTKTLIIASGESVLAGDAVGDAVGGAGYGHTYPFADSTGVQARAAPSGGRKDTIA